MHVPATQRVTSEFTDRNALLYALLGALSFAEHCEQTLVCEPASPPSSDPSVAPPALVDALLGLIAFNRALATEVRACAAQSADISVEPAPARPSVPTLHTSLLR